VELEVELVLVSDPVDELLSKLVEEVVDELISTLLEEVVDELVLPPVSC
jgi:hypothetical protein